MHLSLARCLLTGSFLKPASALMLLFFTVVTKAEDLRFGLLAKSTSDQNFVDTWRGCQEAASADGNHCVLLGAAGPANAHVQRNELSHALQSGEYSAIAISVAESSFLAAVAAESDVPLLSFDSPFSEADQHLSEGYIGPDNYAFGEQLAGMALSYRPGGGVVCILTVGTDPNLQERVAAVRQTLAGDHAVAPNSRLIGQSGWHEHERCPTMSLGSTQQVKTQFKAILTEIKPHMIISVGHWPVVDDDLYRELTHDVTPMLKNEHMRMIVGVGRVSDEYRALLYEGLVHGLVSIDFTEIGRVTYQQLKRAARGETVPLVTHTQKVTVLPELYVRATPEASP